MNDKDLPDAQDAAPAEDAETRSFKLIMAAGMARSYAFEALAEARKHNFDRADELLEQARQAEASAHAEQTKLLSQEARGCHTAVDMLLVHAQDHLMTALLARELIEEIVNLYRVKADKEA